MSIYMSAYERRERIREEKKKLRNLSKRMDKLVHVHGLCVRYEVAHKEAFGWAPEVNFQKGWYRVCGNWNRSYQEKDLIKATEELYAIKHERQLAMGQDDATT
jgi:hypothetical protein